MAGSTKRWTQIAAWGGLGVVALLAAAWVARGSLVAALANGALEDRGMRCDALWAAPSWDLTEVEVERTTCHLAEGRVARLSLPAGARARLDGTRVAAVSAPTLVVALRERVPLEGLFAAVLAPGEVPEPMRRALDGFAALCRRDDVPRIEVEGVSVERGGRTIHVRDLVMERDGDGLRVDAAAITPARMGRSVVRVGGRIADFRGRATPSRARFTGRIEIELRIGRIERSRALPFELSGEGLDGDEPAYDFEVEGAERLRALRERLERLRERRARRPGLRERIRARRERLDRMRERLESRR
ncbi:MAG TPA: hypothetical protein RMH99_03250 [Sandaracinaceae bacterium LLY-WYZ-13_1]|nr:hypothetical protein [Sandaracinaceae bacterium LLY-WYZ-13_1]